MVDKALQFYIEVQTHLEADNVKFNTDANKHQCKKVFQRRFGDDISVP